VWCNRASEKSSKLSEDVGVETLGHGIQLETEAAIETCYLTIEK
jgi:adenosine deaminase